MECLDYVKNASFFTFFKTKSEFPVGILVTVRRGSVSTRHRYDTNRYSNVRKNVVFFNTKRTKMLRKMRSISIEIDCSKKNLSNRCNFQGYLCFYTAFSL